MTLSTVPVPGGDLTVMTWGDGRPVLAIHGITASHLAWSTVARSSPGRLIAPDLRGRGGSAGLPGPHGMTAHAADCLRVLDAFGLDRVVVVGHSMGAFVGAVLAHRHPERVDRLVLVDGGAPLPAVDDIETALGPALRRLDMTFRDREQYREFWRAHPAFGEWSADIESYVDYDLTGTAPDLRSRVDGAAVRTDFADLHHGAAPREAFEALRPDTILIRATRGLMDEPSPLYPDPTAFPFPVRTVDANHYSILFGAAGATAVADALA